MIFYEYDKIQQMKDSFIYIKQADAFGHPLVLCGNFEDSGLNCNMTTEEYCAK